MHDDLWDTDDASAWRAALARYDDVIAAQGIPRLVALDRWYQHELPAAIASRTPLHCTHGELVRVTEWKMTRGVWRARNLQLVKGNDPDLVARTSAEALAAAPHPTAPVKLLSALEGVGPATASAVCAAAEPSCYPFLDEIVAVRVPTLGPVAFTSGYYARYARELRAKAQALGADWTAARVERAIYAAQGGKKGWQSTDSPVLRP